MIENKDLLLTIDTNLIEDKEFGYRFVERETIINDLIIWISEAKVNDKDLMKDDLKYLISLQDKYIFSSLGTNEYITESDDKETFDELMAEIEIIYEENKKIEDKKL